jgi:biopolymer transport protein ExbD
LLEPAVVLLPDDFVEIRGLLVAEAKLREARRVAAAGGSARPVLIKADASLTMQGFLEVCELARGAGFPGV